MTRPGRVLCDTHILLWALAEPERLSRRAIETLEQSEVFVSAASIWEIAIKAGIGRIVCDPDQVADAVESVGFRHLPVLAEHAARVAKLPLVHRDPFDRLLIAQGQCEGMPLLTADETLAAYGSDVEIV